MIASLLVAVAVGVVSSILAGLICENSNSVTRYIIERGLRLVPAEDRGTERSIIESDLASIGDRPLTRIVHSTRFTIGTVRYSCLCRLAAFAGRTAVRLHALAKHRRFSERDTDALDAAPDRGTKVCFFILDGAKLDVEWLVRTVRIWTVASIVSADAEDGETGE